MQARSLSSASAVGMVGAGADATSVVRLAVGLAPVAWVVVVVILVDVVVDVVVDVDVYGVFKVPFGLEGVGLQVANRKLAIKSHFLKLLLVHSLMCLRFH